MRNFFIDIKSHGLSIKPAETFDVSLIAPFRHQLHPEADAEDRRSFFKYRFVEHADQSGPPQIRHRVSEMTNAGKNDLFRRANVVCR